ncbi:DsrE family protein [Bradyrhizobium mercantei]|uniref:DsrE family protein n=1 Tax=Bradyrhizobium mercantei TaxID=1904807 RepID=UPI000975B719|nr:DsrE family protein [Bradyrhizobium mercantei]
MRVSRRLVTLAAGLALAFAVPFAVTLLLTGSVSAVSRGEPKKPEPRVHHVVLPINSDDPTTMRALISTALNLPKYYRERNEPFEIEVVAYNAGVHMLRADTSPVKDLLRVVRGLTPDIRFVVCEATKLGMERAEGHPLVLLDNVDLVPNGPGRIIELQEAGWSYIRS